MLSTARTTHVAPATDRAADACTAAPAASLASTTDASNYLSIGQWNFGGNAALQLYKTSLAATFAGAVTIGNTVNTVSPTSPNRTVTMVVNGVTLYLAAKTTND